MIKKIISFPFVVLQKVFLFIYNIIKYIVLGVKEMFLGILKLLKSIIKLLFKFINKAIKFLINAISYEIKGIIFTLKKAIVIAKKTGYFIFKLVRYFVYGVYYSIKFLIIKLIKFFKYFYIGIKWLAIKIYKGTLWISKKIFPSLRFLFISVYKFFLYEGKGLVFVLKMIFVESLILIGKGIYLFTIKLIPALIPSVGDAAEDFGKKAKSLPKKIKERIINSFKNSNFVKFFSNKNVLNKEELLLDFEGEEADRSEKMVTYAYVAKDKDGNIVRDTFDAFSKVDVHSYLLSEGYDVYEIKTSKWIQFLNTNISGKSYKVKNKDLPFILTQLATYIKAGIPLVESLKIITRQTKGKSLKKVFKGLIYELTMGETLSESMNKQGEVFPKLLINMVKTAELTGDLSGTLENMSEYYDAIYKTKKQMVSALMYPILVLVFAMGVTVFLLISVIPAFVGMFSEMDTELPNITKVIIAASEYLQKNAIWLGIGLVVFVIGYRILYKKVKIFRMINQWLLMHVPVIGKVIIYNEVTMFTKTFASLQNHNILIVDSMEILNKITNNEIYKVLILDTISNLAHGESISNAFKNQWAFPATAYEMLITGERTGELGAMMQKVADYYQEQHRLQVAQIKTFVEPAMITLLAGIVGTIVLSIILPMFSMYGSI